MFSTKKTCFYQKTYFPKKHVFNNNKKIFQSKNMLKILIIMFSHKNGPNESKWVLKKSTNIKKKLQSMSWFGPLFLFYKEVLPNMIYAL